MSKNASAVRNELRAMNGVKFLDRAQCPVKVTNWRLLVQPLPPKKTFGETEIEIPDMVQQAEEVSTSVGCVIDMGEFAFKSRTNAGLNLDEAQLKPTIGSFVLFAQYAGQAIELQNDARSKLRIIDDVEVLAVITDPEMIKRYI